MSCGVPTLSTFLHPENKRYSNDPKSMQMAFRMARIFQCEIARSIFDRVQNWVPKKGWFTTAPCALNFDRYQQNSNRAESFSVLTSCRKPLSGGSHTGWLVLVWYLRRCTMMLLCGCDVCSVLHISTTLLRITIFHMSHSDKTSIAGEDSK
jgi:hypothetical protein